MDFNLVFTKSGDTIKLVSHNAKLVNYYIESLNNKNKNNFQIYNNNLIDNICYLEQCVEEINFYFSSKLNCKTFSEFIGLPLYNQNTLNKLHMVWVKFQLHNERAIKLLYKADNILMKRFRDINNILHNIEDTKFKVSNFNSFDMWSTENIFGTDIIDFNHYNVEIQFNNLGRSTYEKWKNHDNNIDDIDTNDFQLLSGELLLRTDKPYNQSAPETYKNYCKNNGFKLVGNTVGLGNFVESIDIVQDVLYRNMKIGCTNLKLVV